MKKTQEFLPLFKQFIKDSETGKRLKKNGERIRASSNKNYSFGNIKKGCPLRTTF